MADRIPATFGELIKAAAEAAEVNPFVTHNRVETRDLYYPDSPFLMDKDLIYLLQENHKPMVGVPLVNDITIKITAQRGGKNPMPADKIEALVKYLTTAANDFLFEEFNYAPKEE